MQTSVTAYGQQGMQAKAARAYRTQALQNPPTSESLGSRAVPIFALLAPSQLRTADVARRGNLKDQRALQHSTLVADQIRREGGFAELCCKKESVEVLLEVEATLT